MLNFGILGCGGIADRFCNVLRKEPGAAIRAVAARDADKAAAFRDRHRAARSCSYAELVRDSGVDIVYIATVHSHHYEQIKLCLVNGKHVLCEKPMVLHGAQARECFALARQKNLFLMEAMWVRCNPCVREATRWVREGLIGEVKLIKADFCYASRYVPESRIYNPALAGGALYDVGVYVIEFATGILGENPSHISGALQYAPTGADVTTSVSLGFPCGAVASLNCAVNVSLPSTALIYGTGGYIQLDDFWRTHDATRYDNAGNIAEHFHAEFEDGFSYQIQHVVDLMKRGALESDLIPPADTLACADVFDTLLSIREGFA
jgi:predicted dehydrogenase